MGQTGRRDRWASLRDTVRTQLWPLPTLGVVCAVLLGVVLPELDRAVDDRLPSGLTDYLFGGGPDAARTVLQTIAGSLITVTSLTFSLTVVTLQLASSQFSPRLLRTFTRDRFVQATLALFLGTFTFALTVLRTVRTAADQQAAFVPQLSVTVAFVLAVASVLGLVLFLAHLAREIRVETMLATVEKDAQAAVAALLPERDGAAPTQVEPIAPPETAPIWAAGSGFLVRVDEAELVEAAVDADAVAVIDRPAGSSLVVGSPIGRVWPRGAHRLAPDELDTLSGRLADAIITGTERTSVQDVGFGLRQLVDVAVKALSPGINDPTTAVHALGHLSALLCAIAHRELAPVVLRDDQDVVRAVVARPAFADLLDEAVTQPRRYGAADPAVLTRLFQLLAEVGWAAGDPAVRSAVGDQLARLRATAAAQDFDPTERAGLERHVGDVTRALAGSLDGNQLRTSAR